MCYWRKDSSSFSEKKTVMFSCIVIILSKEIALPSHFSGEFSRNLSSEFFLLSIQMHSQPQPSQANMNHPTLCCHSLYGDQDVASVSSCTGKLFFLYIYIYIGNLRKLFDSLIETKMVLWLLSY